MIVLYLSDADIGLKLLLVGTETQLHSAYSNLVAELADHQLCCCSQAFQRLARRWLRPPGTAGQVHLRQALQELSTATGGRLRGPSLGSPVAVPPGDRPYLLNYNSQHFAAAFLVELVA